MTQKEGGKECMSCLDGREDMGFEGQWGRALGRDSGGSMRADAEASAQTRWKCRYSLESADIRGQEHNRERITLGQL